MSVVLSSEHEPRKRWVEPDRWCVYRIYHPETGELLYVGQTCKRNRRMKQHQIRQPWFIWHRQSVPIVYEEHDNQDSSLIAESVAIASEYPIHNKDGNRRSSAETHFRRNLTGWHLIPPASASALALTRPTSEGN